MFIKTQTTFQTIILVILSISCDTAHTQNKVFTVINFFELTNPSLCQAISVTEFDLAKLWVDEEFLDFAKDLAPKNVKPKFGEYLDDLIQDQMKQLQEHFQLLKKNIMDNFNQNEQVFFKSIADNLIKQFQNILKLALAEKDCPKYQTQMMEILTKIENVNFKEELLQVLFDGENGQEIAYDYFLDQSDCKNNLIETLLKGTQYPRISKDWKDNYFSKAKEFIFKNYKASYLDKTDYFEFLDFYSISVRDEKSTNFVLAKISYFNLDIYDFLFEDYTEKQTKLYQILYKVINLHRAGYKGSRESQLKDFSDFLDRHNFSEEDKDFYLPIKFLLYYYSKQTNSDVKLTFNKLCSRNSLVVNKLIEDIPRIRHFVVLLNRKAGLQLKINNFEKAVGETSGEELNRNIAEYFDELIRKEMYKGDNQDFPFYLNELNSSNDKNKARKVEIENAVLLYVFSYFLREKKIDFVKMKSFEIIFTQLVTVNKSTKFEFLERILKAISTTEVNYFELSRKMLQFFKNTKVIDFMKNTTRSITDSLNPSHVLFCEELIRDYETFNGATIDFCSKMEMKPVSKFDDNFFQNFIKMMSIIKVFEFYEDEDDEVIIVFRQFYKYNLMNKSSYLIESLDNNLALNYNAYLSGNEIETNFKVLSGTFTSFRDIIRIFNIKNIGFNHNDLENVHFDKIHFSKLRAIIIYFRKATNSEKVISFLDALYGYYQDKKHNYHFNNIYLIVKSDYYRRTIANAEERNNQIKNKLISSNVFKKEEFNNLPDFHNVKLSKNTAFFFYLEFIQYYKEKEYSDLLLILQEDLRNLQKEEKMYFFATLFGQIKKSQNVLELTNDIPKEANPDELFQARFLKYLKDFRSEKLKANSLLKSFIAFDVYNFLFEQKDFEQIYQLDLFEELIENPLYLFKKNYQRKNMEPTMYYLKMIINNNTELKIEQDNIAIFTYYLISKFYSTEVILPFFQPGAIGGGLQNFVDKFYKDYYERMEKGGKEEKENEESQFNVRNLYAVVKSLILNIHPTNDFELKEELLQMVPLNFNTVIYLAYFTDFENRNIYKQLDFPQKDEYLKIFNNELSVLKAQKGELDYKYILYYNELNRNVFRDLCPFEEFDIILRQSHLALNVEFLKKIKNICLNENKAEIFNNNMYQLLKPLKDQFNNYITKPEVTDYIRKIFYSITKEVLKKMSKKDLFVILQKILLNNKTVAVNKDFVTFLTEVMRRYSFAELKQVEQELVDKNWVEKFESEVFANMFMRDFITFYDFNAEFDLEKINLEDMHLFEIVMFKQKYSFFLSNLFNHADFKQDFALRSNIHFYFLMNKFRSIYLNEVDFFDSNNQEEYKTLEINFSRFLHDEYEKKLDTELKTRYLYMIVVDYFYNIKNTQSLNLGEDTNCQMIIDFAIILVEQSEEMKINTKEFASFLNTNNEMKNNFDAYFFETKKMLAEKNSDYYFKKCEMSIYQASSKKVKEFYGFYLKLYPDTDLNKINAAHFELTSKIKKVKFNQQSYFQQKERLLI
jgi:hypothetical protein